MKCFFEQPQDSAFELSEDGEQLDFTSKVVRKEDKLCIFVDEKEAQVDIKSLKVISSDSELQKRVECILQEAMLTLVPLGEPWSI